MPESAKILRISVVNASGSTLDEEALAATVQAISTVDESVGAILFDHPGKNFCFGGNVTQFAGAADPHAYIAEAARRLHTMILAVTSSPLPVVVGAQGWAAGAGLSIVCAADIVVAGESSRFRAAYPGIGFTPDGGMTWNLPRAVGRARAMDIIMTNRVVHAEEALAIGLVSRIVADDAVHSEAEQLAASLAAGPREAFAGIKRLVAEGAYRAFSDQLDAEAASIADRAASPDGLEGVRAFHEHRAPQFGQRAE